MNSEGDSVQYFENLDRKRGSHFLRREEQKREIGAVAKRIVGKGDFIDGAGLAGLAAIQCLLVPPPLCASASRRFVLLDSIVAVEESGFERDGKRFGFARLDLRSS